MTSHRLGQVNKNQRGFTLIEVLIAIAISGIIGGSITMVISQVFDVNARSVTHMTAVSEVENAIHWIARDAQMAQNVAPTPPNPNNPNEFPLTLTWGEWGNTLNNATYSVQNGQLQRNYSVNGGQPSTTVVVRHINSGSQMTNWKFNGVVLTFKITASIDGPRPASETRSFEVFPKAVP